MTAPIGSSPSQQASRSERAEQHPAPPPANDAGRGQPPARPAAPQEAQGAARQAARGAEQQRIDQLSAGAAEPRASTVQRGVVDEAQLRANPALQRLSDETRNDVIQKITQAPPA